MNIQSFLDAELRKRQRFVDPDPEREARN